MEDRTRRNPLDNFSFRFPVSLRTRLILANVLIIAVSVGALGYYVFYRSQQTNAFLSDELDTSTRQKAVDSLTATGDAQAATLSEMFADIRRQTTSVGLSADMMLTKHGEPGTGTYWDAKNDLARLPNGSWDNIDRTEPGSVFLPASVQQHVAPSPSPWSRRRIRGPTWSCSPSRCRDQDL